jgi:hypothetical protein
MGKVEDRMNFFWKKQWLSSILKICERKLALTILATDVAQS